MSNCAVYIRNVDKRKFGEQSYSGVSGVLLTRFLGRRKLASERGVPLFYRNGTYVGNMGYPAGQPKPEKRGKK